MLFRSTVGKTVLHYDARCLDDVHAMLKKHGDWMDLGGADEQGALRDGDLDAVDGDAPGRRLEEGAFSLFESSASDPLPRRPPTPSIPDDRESPSLSPGLRPMRSSSSASLGEAHVPFTLEKM